MGQPDNINSNRFRDLGMLVFCTFLIGFSPALVKVLAQASVGYSAIGFWRGGVGGVTLLIIVFAGGKSLRLHKSTMIWSLLAGLFFAMDLFVWHRAVMYIGSGMSTLMGNLQVFITAVFSYFIFKEKLTLRFILAAAAAMGGITMLVGLWSSEISFTGNYLTGIILGFCTAATYALFLLAIKKATQQPDKADAAVIMTWVSICTAVLLAAVGIMENEQFLPSIMSLENILYLLAIGVFIQAVAWMGITGVLGRIDVHFAALILLLQPVLAIIWGYVFFRESLGLIQILGAGITLTAVYLGTVTKKV